MITEEEKVENIKQVFFEYARDNELSAFDTSNYFARQILPDEFIHSFILRRKIVEDLIGSGNMIADNRKWVIKITKNKVTTTSIKGYNNK